MHRVFFRWRSFAIAQQLTGVFAVAISTAKILAKTAGFELHITAAFIAFNNRPIIAFYLKAALFNLIPIASWVITTDMQLTMLVDQVAIHCSTAFCTTFFLPQCFRFHFVFIT